MIEAQEVYRTLTPEELRKKMGIVAPLNPKELLSPTTAIEPTKSDIEVLKPALSSNAERWAYEAEKEFVSDEDAKRELEKSRPPGIGTNLINQLGQQGEGAQDFMNLLEQRVTENYKLPSYPEFLAFGPMALPRSFAQAINAKELVPQMAEGIWKGTLDSWKSMITNPGKFIRERPGDFLMNIFDVATVAGAGVGLVSKGAKLARTANFVRAMNVLEEEGRISGKLYKFAIEHGPKRVRGPNGEMIELTKEIKDLARKNIPDDAIIVHPKSVAGFKPQIKEITPSTNLEELYSAPLTRTAGDIPKTALGRGIRDVKKTIKWTFMSPDFVMGNHPATKKIWSLSNMEDLGERGFLKYWHDTYKNMAKDLGYKNPQEFFDSPVDTAVGKVIDSDLTVRDVFRGGLAEIQKAELTAEELDAIRRSPGRATRYESFLKDSYDSMYRQWGRSMVSAAKEKELWQEALTRSRKKEFNQAWQKYKDSLPSKTEQEVFDIYSHREASYFPHLWFEEERASLAGMLKQYRDMIKNPVGLKPEDIQKLKHDERVIASVVEKKERAMSLDDLRMDKSIPRQLQFKNFLPRDAQMPGYSNSAGKVFYKYMHGISRKIYKDKVLREAWTLLDDPTIPYDLKEYTNKYLREYIGWDRPMGQDASNIIKGIMWNKNLGFLNPRPSLQNKTQCLNTVAKYGIKRSIQGWELAQKPGMRKLFEETGLLKYAGELEQFKDIDVNKLFKSTNLGTTIPEYMMGGGTIAGTKGLEDFTKVSGIFMKWTELGNLQHGFSTAFIEFKTQGYSTRKAILMAMDSALEDHFRYGAVGSALYMRGWGGVATQYWSYPLKQMEWLVKQWKKDPRTVVSYLMLTEGAKMTTAEFLDIDLTNSVGVGLNMGEVLSMVESLSKQDLDEALKHFHLSGLPRSKKRGGLVPTSFGPGVQEPIDFIAKVQKGDVTWDDLLRLVMPSGPIGYKGIQAARSLIEGPIGKDEEGGPQYGVRPALGGDLLYKESPMDIINRTLFFRPNIETKKHRQRLMGTIANEQDSRHKAAAANLWAVGKKDEAKAYMLKQGYAWTDKLAQALDARVKAMKEKKGKELTERMSLSKDAQRILDEWMKQNEH